MAIVQGIREKVHLPIYDSLSVEAKKQLREAEPTSILKFFVDVQRKTKLETNLQSASLLPHYNTFEARAMRVVISDLPPEFPDDRNGEAKDIVVEEVPATGAAKTEIATASFSINLKRLMELLEEARESGEGEARLSSDDPDVKNIVFTPTTVTSGDLVLSVADLEDTIDGVERNGGPPKEQIRPNNGAGTIIGKLIYNTVTTLYVGEKIMIQMPTWFFPAGAGPYSERGNITTHGEPSPTATFRFAEPIFIDKQQNFRVEIEIPDTDTLKEIQSIYGPLNIWVVLDGYMTRDVQ
jgi:hypothetical protein